MPSRFGHIHFAIVSVVLLAAAPVDAEPFSRSLELQGITFELQSPNTADNTLTVTPKGLSSDNSPITVPVEGDVVQAEVADMNVDGSPELYVGVRGAAADAATTLLAWSANRKKSISMISVPALTPEQAVGHAGGDEYAVVENVIVRRFPLKDGIGTPTGKTRQLQYKLRPGEASWKLVVDRVVDY